VQDEARKNAHAQLAQMITSCQSNPDLCAILYSKFVEAQTALCAAGDSRPEECFGRIPKTSGSCRRPSRWSSFSSTRT